LIAVAQHLEAAGHLVVVFAVEGDLTERCRRAGLAATCVNGGSKPNTKPEPQRSLRFGQRMTNPNWLRRWLEAVLIRQIPAQVTRLQRVLRDHRPEVVITSAMAYSGAIAAELGGIPWASFATGLQSIPPERFGIEESCFRDLEEVRNEVIGAFEVRLAFRLSDVVSPWLNVVFAPPELVPEELRGGARFLGAALTLGARGDEKPFPFERLPSDRPIVYIAFGSLISHGPEVYSALTRALAPEEAFFVLALKDLLHDAFVRDLPEHALAVEWAPQLDVLERTHVMVNHGGANSVVECLARGKPMMVIPLTSEQQVIGHLVENAGVGTVLQPDRATPELCRATLLNLMAVGSPARARAAAIGAGSQSGAAQAARLLERLAEERRPMTER
jgi:MGT family glycosyltransferase